MMRANAFQNKRGLAKLGKPVDREEWGMTPQTVNAYYSPPMNEIVFPAAILQPPFFDMRADDAVNYGAIGAVIGHEISHGFDDEGSQFDGDGKLDNWWTAADRKAFDSLTAQLVTQYNAYEPLPGRKLIFTSGSKKHAENVTKRLGIHGHFETVFDIVSADYIPKPAPGTYDRFLEAHDVDPTRAAMFEDLSRNLEPPHALGMRTVLVVPGARVIERDSWELEGGGAHVHHVTDDLAGFLHALR
eukprot:gene54615-72981_t